MNLAYLLLFAATLPLLFVASWSDLRTMTIPNRVNMGLFLVFVILGIFIFPLPEFGWRLLQAVIMLFIGIFLTSAGLMGGGDSKLLAAGAPFVATGHITEVFLLMAILSLAAVVAHRGLGLIPIFKKHVSDWASWNTKGNFPFGVPIAATLSLYLLVLAGFG
jgi:prepilin peptidase CpaA